ncbi:MAG: prepilin peptidase [Candidatus Harrisonbacteria bacterium]|nr:prepilin peptidase [Candidatus Harrisonbacteria bacterium]
MTIFLLFLFGLITGSFLNVVSFRYDPEKSVFNFRNLLGRSHCPFCRKTLRWYELIPVLSFVVQLGKCRSCGAKLSWQYPLVELTSGLIFLLPLYFSNYTLTPKPYTLIESIIWILVFLTFLLIWTIDYRLYLIPDELNWALVILGLVLILSSAGNFGEFQGSFIGPYASLFGLRQNIWLNHLFGAGFGILLTGAIIFLTRGKGMGMGDLKLLGALGFLYGWPDVLFIFMFGSLVGGVVSAVLLLIRRWGMKSQVPFGPFLILGAMLVFFFGEFLLRQYFTLFEIL